MSFQHFRWRIGTRCPAIILWYVENCESILRLADCAAAKHVDGIEKKARLWSLLEDIENRLGFHTTSRITSLQKLEHIR